MASRRVTMESFPVQQIADSNTRTAIDRLQRALQFALSPDGFVTQDDLAALKRLVQTPGPAPSSTTTHATNITQTQTLQETPEIPTVSGDDEQIWTLEVVAEGLPATLNVINQSPGDTSPVDNVTGSGGDPLSYAQINIYGTYVYPAADENLGFGGFLNFVTRNRAGTKIQGAFINGGLVGTLAGSERGDLDFGIYGHRPGEVDGAGGGNIPRLVALREDAGQLHLVVDADDEWNLGNFSERWKDGFFSGLVQCGGVDLRYNPDNDWALAIGNPSDMLDPGPFAVIATYLKVLLNLTPVYIPLFSS